MKNKGNPQSLTQFKEFVDECSPQQAMQIERQWRKKRQQQNSRCYTKIMVIGVVVMVAIFISLISILTVDKPQKHFQIQQVTYKNVRYTYLQSNYPHLKFLIPPQNTKEIRLLRSIGIIYAQLIAWIEANVTPSMKVLFVPHEESMVNVLGIALGYYVRGSLGGSVTIGVSGIKFGEMTQKNIELMNSGLGEKMPIKVVFADDFKGGQYDLIVLQDRQFHKKIDQFSTSTIVMIRRENAQTTIMNSVFSSHSKYEIVRGSTSGEVRSFPILYGYSIIPYVASQKTDLNIILLQPRTAVDVQLCQQSEPQFVSSPQMRNLVQHLKNQTFTNVTFYYGLSNKAAIFRISKLKTIKYLYTNLKQSGANSTYVASPAEIPISSPHIYIANLTALNSIQLTSQDTLYLHINNNDEKKALLSKFRVQWYELRVLSPFNNRGCYYPPSVCTYAQDKEIRYPYVMIVRVKESSPQNR